MHWRGQVTGPLYSSRDPIVARHRLPFITLPLDVPQGLNEPTLVLAWAILLRFGQVTIPKIGGFYSPF